MPPKRHGNTITISKLSKILFLNSKMATIVARKAYWEWGLPLSKNTIHNYSLFKGYLTVIQQFTASII